MYIDRRAKNKESKLVDEIIPVKLFGFNEKTVEVNKPPYKKNNYKKEPCF